MIVLDYEQCNGCGMCAMVCHNCCLHIDGGMAGIDDALCDRCAQCVAVCPQRALSWDGMPPIQGIGSCLWGAGRIILDRSREARDWLGLHERERILGVLLLGYPAVTFRNKVEGRTLPVVWNVERESRERDHEAES